MNLYDTIKEVGPEAVLQARVFGQHYPVERHTIVDLLEAVDDRPSLYGHVPVVLDHVWVRSHTVNRHGEIQLDYVAFLPFPLDSDIAAFHLWRSNLSSVYRQPKLAAPRGNTEP